MIGLMRVKNEARWIERCVRSILPCCESVLVMDDHSTDGTPEICAALPGVTVLPSPFEGLDEARDKGWMLDQVRGATDWVLMIDGDEMLDPTSVETVKNAVNCQAQALSFRILYLWDEETSIRLDGVYGRFWRPSMFRPGDHQFLTTGAGGNFHCGNTPLGLQRVAQSISANLLHFGYLHREDRIRKYQWYNARDPHNRNEDGYRHMVIGDLYPADSSFRHAGPLLVEALCHQ